MILSCTSSVADLRPLRSDALTVIDGSEGQWFYKHMHD